MNRRSGEGERSLDEEVLLVEIVVSDPNDEEETLDVAMHRS